MAVNIQAKQMLAKLLATENLTIIHAGTRTASFSPKKRILTLPIWKDMSGDIYDVCVIHEIAHALFSPHGDEFLYAAYEKVCPQYPKAAKRFINVVEDARIERLVKITYPGSKMSFIRGYTELVERDFFGTKGRDINEFGIVDRLNIYFKTCNMDIKFTDREMEFVREMEKALTFDDVVDISERLYQYAKEERDKKKAEETDDNGSESDKDDDSSGKSESSIDRPEGYDEDEDDITIDPDSDQDESEDGDKDEAGTTENEETGKADETKTPGAPDQNKDRKETDEILQGEDPVESITDQTWEKLQGDFYDADAKPIRYLGLPQPRLDKIIVPYKKVHHDIRNFFVSRDIKYRSSAVQQHTTEFERFKQENKPVIDWLLKEFDMYKAADQYARVQTSRTGILDLKRLNQYKFADDLLKKVTTIPGGKNHALEIFVDWSNSMSDHVLGTVHQLINVAIFARKAQIPFNAYTFGANIRYDRETNSGIIANTEMFIFKEDDFSFHVGYTLRQVLSSQMSASEFNNACVNLLLLASGIKIGYSNMGSRNIMPGVPEGDWMGGTPLNETIVTAIAIVDNIRKKSNAIVNTIFITDGEGTTDGKYICNEFGETRGINYETETMYLRDIVTHIDYEFTEETMQHTKQFLNILKNRTGVNVVGFFISGNNKPKRAQDIQRLCFDRWQKGIPEQSKIYRELDDNGFILVADMGYTEMYIILGGKQLQIKLPTTLKVPMSNAMMVTNMTEQGINQRKNRVVLTRFIKLIS
jgi:hypothetical protein